MSEPNPPEQTRGELEVLLRDYLAERTGLEDLARWLGDQPVDAYEPPLRADLEITRETVDGVRNGDRSEQELRDLAASLVPNTSG